MLNKEAILAKLKNVIDPDFKENIVDLGFIKKVEIDGGAVEVEIELTTPACPVKEDFRNQSTELISSLEGVKKVNIILGARKSGPKPKANRENLSRVDKIIGVASCKGGVGKSTVSALLASELASRGFKVGLFDTDIFGPSLPALFDVMNANVYMDNDFIRPLQINENLKVMSFGFLLKDSPAIMRGAMVSNYIMELINKVDWGEVDYLFIDMPPGTGDVQLTLSQNLNLDGVVMVTTAHILSVVDVQRGIMMFEKVNVPVIGLVENMSYFVCDSCDKKHFIFDKSSLSLKERFGIENNIELPFLKKQDIAFTDYKSNPVAKYLTDEVVKIIGKRSLKKESAPQFEYDKTHLRLIYPEKTFSVSHFKVRVNCGCALCKDEMTGKPKINEKLIPKTIHPVEITPLGNYALSINWSDDHTSGIYPFELIKSLSDD